MHALQVLENYDITELEMINILVAAKNWATHWANKRIRIFSDNLAVRTGLNHR